MLPLYKLTGKDTPYEWKDEQNGAFKEILKKLMTPPVLAPPRFGHPFIVETDASKHALGYCLLQENEKGEIHPILYESRTTNREESRYQSVELEALGLVYALQEFRPYLEGTGTSTVKTDSAALCALLKRRDVSSRIAKYQMAIQAFDINIIHRSGKSNAFCNYVSRYISAITVLRSTNNHEPNEDKSSKNMRHISVITRTALKKLKPLEKEKIWKN
uniref:Reverse transcriptase/retrotransposon-derived protein RNase H-like domain-containing protein n=1 Tax=Acrobeloides nanus TaxID=290746 RepID=A0A914D1H7_9BILA